MKCLNEIQILKEFVISTLQDDNYKHIVSKLRLDVTKLIFQNYFRLFSYVQDCVSNLSIVSLKKRKNDERFNFAFSINIMNSHEFTLVSLYFKDEMIRSKRHFYHRYFKVFLNCEVMKKLNERLVLDRIKIYERKQLSFNVVTS